MLNEIFAALNLILFFVNIGVFWNNRKTEMDLDIERAHIDFLNRFYTRDGALPAPNKGSTNENQDH